MLSRLGLTPRKESGVTLLAKLFAARTDGNQWPELVESFPCLTSTVRCLCSKLGPGKLTPSIPVAVGTCNIPVAKLSSSLLPHS